MGGSGGGSDVGVWGVGAGEGVGFEPTRSVNAARKLTLCRRLKIDPLTA